MVNYYLFGVFPSLQTIIVLKVILYAAKITQHIVTKNLYGS